MKLKYTLNENYLVAGEDVYTAYAHDVNTHDMAEIVRRMEEKGNLVTDVDIQAVLRAFFNEVENITAEGGSVNTELFNTGFSIQGLFEGANDSFDPSRHQVKVNFQTGRAIKEIIPQIHLEKMTSASIAPMILEVKDATSESVNSLLTSGGAITIIGSMLKVQGDHPSNGVYLIDSNAVRYKANIIVTNLPSSLVVILPVVSPEEYTLEIVTQFSGGGETLRDSRKGSFKKTLRVL